MSKKYMYLIAVAAALVVIVYYWFWQDDTAETGILPGEVAIDYTLTDLNGEEHSLSDYRGKTVFFSMWTLTCSACRQQNLNLTELQKASPKDVVLLGIVLARNEEEVRNYLANNDIDYPVLIDKTGEVAEKYQVRYVPMNIIVDSEGVILKSYPGANESADQILMLINQLREK